MLHFYFSWKDQKPARFSDIFRGHEFLTLGRNGLNNCNTFCCTTFKAAHKQYIYVREQKTQTCILQPYIWHAFWGISKHFQKKKYIDPASNYMLNVNSRNTRKRCEMCSRLTIKIPEWRGWVKILAKEEKYQ